MSERAKLVALIVLFFALVLVAVSIFGSMVRSGRAVEAAGLALLGFLVGEVIIRVRKR